MLEKCFGHKNSVFQPRIIFYSVVEAICGSDATPLKSEQHEGPKVDNNNTDNRRNRDQMNSFSSGNLFDL